MHCCRLAAVLSLQSEVWLAGEIMAAFVKEVKMNGIEDRDRQTAECLNDCGEQVSKKAHNRRRVCLFPIKIGNNVWRHQSAYAMWFYFLLHTRYSSSESSRMMARRAGFRLTNVFSLS